AEIRRDRRETLHARKAQPCPSSLHPLYCNGVEINCLTSRKFEQKSRSGSEKNFDSARARPTRPYTHRSQFCSGSNISKSGEKTGETAAESRGYRARARLR